MKTILLKYNAGNIRSVSFALERIGITPLITDNAEDILSADKIIFPGVGEASTAMTYLKEHKLDQLICSLKQPVLGICLGMQLMCAYSEEGDTDCLGIFQKRVKHFVPPPENEKYGREGDSKVPQIGWNNIYNLKGDLFQGLREMDYQYFVHGYYVEPGENTIATT
ncbi:MAG: imidazole glycerol phosphate synthase subunit HisH, partial [Bacteroidia bacterium]